MLVVILVAAAAGSGLVYLNSTLGSRHLLILVNEIVLKETGLRLAWEDARGSFLFNVVVDRPALLMADGDTLVKAPRIRIGFRPWSVLDGGIELSRIEADAPVVNLPALFGDPSPKNNQEEADTTDKSGGGKSEFRIRRFTVRDGTLQLARRGVVHSIEGIHGRGDMRLSTAGGLQIDIRKLRAAIENWGIVVEDLHGQLVLNQALLWLLDIHARTRDSRLAVEGTLDLSRAQRRGGLRIDLQVVDLHEWWPVIGGKWADDGPVNVRGWLRGKPWEPELELSGDGYIAGIRFDGFTLEGSYAPRNLEAVLVGWGPGADSLQASLAINPDSGEGWLKVAARALRLEATPLEVPVSLHSVQLELQGGSYDPLASGGNLHLIARGVNIYGMEADSIGTLIKLGEGSMATVEPIHVEGAGYRLSADGTIDLDRKMIDLRLNGSTQEPCQPLALVGVGIEKGSIDVDAQITGMLNDPSIRGVMLARSLERKGMRVADTDFRFNVAQIFGARIGNFGMVLDSLHVEPNFDLPEARFNGQVDGETITLRQVTGLWAEGETSLQGNITVSSDSIRARLDKGYLVHRDLVVSDVNGRLDFSPSTGAGPFSIVSRTGGGTVHLTGHRDEDHRLHLRGDLDRIQLGPLSRSIEWGFRDLEGWIGGSFTGQVEKHVEVLSTQIEVEMPTVAGHRYRSLVLDAEYRNGIVEVNTLQVLGTEGDSAGVYGTLMLPGSDSTASDGRLDMDLTVVGVNLAVFQPYLTRQTLRGEISCEMGARGTFTDPRLDGVLVLTDAQVDTFQVEEVVAYIRYDAGRVWIEEGSLKSMGFMANFHGSFPFQLQFNPLQAQMISTGDLQASLQGGGNLEALIQPFRKQIEHIDGIITADIEVGGTIDEPQLDGSVLLDNGALKPAALGQAVENIHMDLALSESEVGVVTLTGRMPSDIRRRRGLLSSLFGWLSPRKEAGGEFSVTGNVTIEKGGRPAFNLNLQGSGLGISDPTGSLAVVVDPDLRLVTRPGNSYPSLDGTVQVVQGLADVGMLLNMFGGSESAAELDVAEGEGLEADVEIEVPGRLRIVGGELGQDVDVELMGNLLIRKNPQSAPYLLGSLESVPGRGHLFMFFHRWSIDEGTVTFGTIEEINPSLDARFSTNVQDVFVLLTLSGTVKEPLTQLSTEGGALSSQRDILELLTLGRGVETSVEESRAGLVGNYLENVVSRTAQDWIGLDTVEMEGIEGLVPGSPLQHTRVSVGRYLGSRLYAKYAQSFGGTTPQQELGIEYWISRRFRLSGMYDRQRRFLLELKWRIDY